MGFFLEDKDMERITSHVPRAPREPNKITSTTPGCDNCIMRESWPRLRNPKMSAYVGYDADIFVIGDAPRTNADIEGIPFARDSLRLLRKAVPGNQWDRLTFQNAVRCSPKNDDAPRPKAAAVHSCSEHLNTDIQAKPYVAIVGLGDTAMRRMIPDYYSKTTATDLAGTFLPIRLSTGDVVWYYQMIGLDVLDKYRNDRGPAWPVFAADFKKFFQQVDKLKKPAILDLNAHKVHVVHSLSEAQALRERMGKVLAWDVETTGLRCTARDELLLTASFSDGETTFAFTVDHPLETNTWAKTFIRDTLLSCERWIAHYSSMELSWAVQHCGLPLSPDQMEDTAAIARIVHDHENLLSLADQSRIWLGTNVKALSDLDTRNLISYPVEDVLRYNGLDSYATKLCFDKNAHITHTSAYRRHIDAIAMTVQMQLYGLPYSLDKSLELKTKWQAKAVAAEQKAHTIYEVKEWQRNTRKEWSITSDQDTADALVRFGHIKLPKTEAGNYVTSEPILLSVAPDNPLVKSVLDYREAAKLVSTYIDPLIEATKRHYDNIPHPCYNVLLTATERLSSEDPNIQNFPRRANVELREQIVAPPGHIMVAFDYGQLEARLIAMASKDQYFCDAVLKGYDIHAEWGPEFVKEYGEFWHMCCEWAGTEEEKKVKKVMRDRIKNKFVFPSFYGANPKSIDGYLELPEGVTAEVHKVFWQRFKGVKQWIEARRAEYDRTGSIRTLTGRTRHSIFSGNEPINTPIQGTAANLASDAMNDCAALARKENDPYLHPRMQIHDDLTFIFPEDHRLETYIDRIFEVMGRCRYDWQILPLLVEAKCGYSWADLDEFATYTGDYVK